jgi:hypothetical protein
MNPCPSARPGEGEQEENRRGDRPVWQRAERAKIGGCRFCSCWGCQGRALASPTNKTTLSRSDALPLREGWKPHGRDPQSRLRDLGGSVHDSPTGNAGRAKNGSPTLLDRYYGLIADISRAPFGNFLGQPQFDWRQLTDKPAYIRQVQNRRFDMSVGKVCATNLHCVIFVLR